MPSETKIICWGGLGCTFTKRDRTLLVKRLWLGEALPLGVQGLGTGIRVRCSTSLAFNGAQYSLTSGPLGTPETEEPKPRHQNRASLSLNPKP